MSEICICDFILKKNQRTPNDQRSDSRNPNNPLSREHVAKLRRLTERTDEMEQGFRVLDRMSDRFDQMQRPFDSIEARFRERQRR